MSDANTELLAQMAKALGDLRERMVFGGGCATALLIFGLSRRCAFLLRSLGRSGIVDTVTISKATISKTSFRSSTDGRR